MSINKLPLYMLSICLALPAVATAEPTRQDTGKVGPNRGLTLDEVARGLKSAAQNIENEIPKIGPAIGETFKKVTGKESQQQSSTPPSKDKKKK